MIKQTDKWQYTTIILHCKYYDLTLIQEKACAYYFTLKADEGYWDVYL